MEYNLVGITEVLIGTGFFAMLAALAWYFASRDDISDNSRTFR
jgi:hypothetical protein